MQRRISWIGAIAALTLMWVLPATAAWQTLGETTQVVKGADSVTLATASGTKLRIAFVTPDFVRVRMASRGEFAPDFSMH